MPMVEVSIRINAPIELCFDLARDIDLHMLSTEGTNEKAVAGVTHGLIDLGEEVTWEATHFGIRQRLTSRITEFDRPYRFRDSQISGAFHRFDHDHIFEIVDGMTLMRDIFDYDSPMGWLGKCADHLFLKSYMYRLLEKRGKILKAAAEAQSLRS